MMADLVVLLVIAGGCLVGAVATRDRIWILVLALVSGFSFGLLVSVFQFFDAFFRLRP